MLPQRFTYPSPGFSHYWNEGAGQKMLVKLSAIPNREAVEANAALLMQTDILANTVITEVFEKLGFHRAGQLIDKALNTGINTVEDAPACLQQLFAEAETIPAWLNQDLLQAGSCFCTRTGAFGLSTLRNYCLMGGYESSAINKPLIYTEALKKGAAKRMAETIEFWVAVTGKDAMQKGNIGFKSAVKLRLMHAYARTAIQKMPDWKTELWGIPINQGDTVATNLGFSIAFMEGLRRLGYRPTEKELTGVLHLWKYIGYLIGIPPSYLPDTEQQAIESLYKWTISQPPADADTLALAHALMNEPLTASYPVRNWQKKVLIQLHLAYNYFFLGPRACQTMVLPPSPLWFMPYLVAGFNKCFEFAPLSIPFIYNRAVSTGRKSQVLIKVLFLKSHNK